MFNCPVKHRAYTDNQNPPSDFGANRRVWRDPAMAGFFPPTKLRVHGLDASCLRNAKSENRLKEDLIEAEKRSFTTWGSNFLK